VPASTLVRAGLVVVAVGVVLLGASPAGAQTASPPPFDSPPLVSDGIDTGVIQTHTGHSRFSIGQHGTSMQHLPAVRENVQLVSKLQMNTPVEFRFDPGTGQPDPTEPPVVPGQIADLAVYKNYVYLNSWSEPSCKRGGIFAVDISNPAAPQQVAFLPAAPNTRHGEGAHVITIGTMDVLAVNNEPLPLPCDQNLPSAGGIDLWNVTNPRNPVPLALGVGDVSDPGDDPGMVHHAHSVFLWKNDEGRAFAVMTDNDEFGTFDVDILEITNPAAPRLIAEHNLTQRFDIEDLSAFGNVMYHHDVVVKKIDGVQTMLVSYWDAGYVKLDVDDPANPEYLGDTTFDGPDPLTGWNPPEGNAHQSEFSHDNRYILAADEDFDTHRFITEINGERIDFDVGIPVTPPPNSVPRFDLLPTPEDPIEGDTRYIGEGCVAAAVPAPQPGETVAVAERGTCDFDLKAANASAAGYDAILIFNNVLGPAPRCDAVNLNMIFDDPNADIKALLIPRSIGFRIINAYDPTTYRCVQNDPTSTPAPAPNRAGVPVRIGFRFDGWGYTHLYENGSGKLRRVDSFAIEEALDERYAFDFGDLSVHEFATDATENVAYSSYYAGGMRVFTFGPEGLTETGKFIDRGGNNFWGVEQFTLGNERYFAGSDRDFGLYIFRYTGPGAAQRPACSDVTVMVPYKQSARVPLACSDANNNPLRQSRLSEPQGGTVADHPPAGGWTYTHTGNRLGPAGSFGFMANDGAADSNTATASLVAVARNGGRCFNPFVGSARRDIIIGSRFGDRIRGAGGADIVRARGAADCVSGGRGNDRLSGQRGRDRLLGNAAADKLFGGPGRDRMRGGPGNDGLAGRGGADRMSGGKGPDRMNGGGGADRLNAGGGTNRLNGGGGNDRLFARNGLEDKVRCGGGNDRVVADADDNVLADCEQVRLR
jgi:RTX calcium-binding nonapeptide repeat (4 copies)